MAISPEQLQALIQGFALAKNRTAASGNNALNQVHPFCYSPNVLFPLHHDLRHTAVMNTLLI
ncbi:hypothetical protein ABVN80_17775 [Acinetobacter baumannii]